MNIRQSFMLAAILAATSALSLDVTLAPAGDIRFGEGNEHVFRSLVALPGWHGLSSKGGWEIKKPGVAPFSLASGTNVLIAIPKAYVASRCERHINGKRAGRRQNCGKHERLSDVHCADSF